MYSFNVIWSISYKDTNNNGFYIFKKEKDFMLGVLVSLSLGYNDHICQTCGRKN